MVRVTGTSGRVVQVEIKGVKQVIEKLRKVGKAIGNETELALVQGGNLLQQEVQESAIGRRAEQKSVETGKFARSIDLDLGLKKKWIIKVSSDVPYAKFLEFDKYLGRRHFRNSLARNKNKIINFVRGRISFKAIQKTFK